MLVGPRHDNFHIHNMSGIVSPWSQTVNLLCEIMYLGKATPFAMQIYANDVERDYIHVLLQNMSRPC